MGHTNATTNYSLPQFVSSDKPAWLTDINGAFSDLDTAVKAAKDAGDNAQSDATQALSDAGGAATTANTANTKASGAIASISEDFLDSATYDVGDLVMYNSLLYKCHTAVTTPGAWTGATNWSRTDVDSLIGAIPTDAAHLPIASNDPTNTKNYIDTNINTINGKIGYAHATKNNLSFYRFGNVVWFNIGIGTNSTTAEGLIITGGTTTVIPSGYRPIENAETYETNLVGRCTCNADGSVWVGRYSQSNITLRIGACWITNDAMPS